MPRFPLRLILTSCLMTFRSSLALMYAVLICLCFAPVTAAQQLPYDHVQDATQSASKSGGSHPRRPPRAFL
jgi:hypothetical protein